MGETTGKKVKSERKGLYLIRSWLCKNFCFWLLVLYLAAKSRLADIFNFLNKLLRVHNLAWRKLVYADGKFVTWAQIVVITKC